MNTLLRIIKTKKLLGNEWNYKCKNSSSSSAFFFSFLFSRLCIDLIMHKKLYFYVLTHFTNITKLKYINLIPVRLNIHPVLDRA